MFNAQLLFFLIWLIVQPAPPAQTPALELPAAARNLMNIKFPDWRYAECSDEVRQFLKRDFPTARPDLISGDFDGDGRTDFAALIIHGVTRVEKSEVVGPDPAIVVFLSKDYGFDLSVIDNPGGEYLMLNVKGAQAFDFERQQEITFTHDVIDAVILEKGATSYVYEQGHFRAIITGD